MTDLPDTTVEEDQSKARADAVISGSHELADLNEAAAVFSESAEVFAEYVGPAAIALLVVEIGLAFSGAMEGASQIYEAMGVCYGIMAEADRGGDPSPPEPARDSIPELSDEEVANMKEAFQNGLQQGHSRLSDLSVRNRLLLNLHKVGHAHLLNALWEQARTQLHPDPGGNLSWPSAGFDH